MLLTGRRSGEIFGPRWDEVNSGHLALADSKIGPRQVLLANPRAHCYGEDNVDDSSTCLLVRA